MENAGRATLVCGKARVHHSAVVVRRYLIFLFFLFVSLSLSPSLPICLVRVFNDSYQYLDDLRSYHRTAHVHTQHDLNQFISIYYRTLTSSSLLRCSYLNIYRKSFYKRSEEKKMTRYLSKGCGKNIISSLSICSSAVLASSYDVNRKANSTMILTKQFVIIKMFRLV